MWFFRSPTIVFGEEALLHIRELKGLRAFVVTDSHIQQAGLLAPVLFQLAHAGMQTKIYDAVPTEPSAQDIQVAMPQLNAFDPDWIVAVGGGSVIDAAKAMWVQFENPDLDLTSISPLDPINIREKAQFMAIPTTAGTGSETTWAFVLSDPGDPNSDEPARKIGTGHPLAVPDYAIVDPIMTITLPNELTADTGIDALTQAIEGYVATWHSDFTDGLCLVATKLVFEHLPQAYANPSNMDAREKMANCAAIAGLGYINSMVGCAHSMGHALGALFKLPHGRAVGLCLPYVIEFYTSEARPADTETRFADIVRFIGLDPNSHNEHSAGIVLADKISALLKTLNLPITLEQAGITRTAFDEALDDLINNSLSDSVIFTSPRQPSESEIRQLFVCAYEGKPVDF